MATSKQLWAREDEVGSFAARDREFEAAEAAHQAALADQSPAARLERLERDERLLPSRMREGYATQADADALRAEIAAVQIELRAARDAAFAAEWTAEVTAARRVVWNAEQAKLTPADLKRPAIALRGIETRLGYTLDHLKRAIALYA